MKIPVSFTIEQLTSSEATSLLFKNPSEPPDDNLSFSLYWFRKDIENCLQKSADETNPLSFWAGTLSILCCMDIMASIFGNKPLHEYANSGEEKIKFTDFCRDILDIRDYNDRALLYSFRNAMVHNGGLINVTSGDTKTYFSISPDVSASTLFSPTTNPNEKVVSIYELYKIFKIGIIKLQAYLESLAPEAYPMVVFELNALRWSDNNVISGSFMQFIERKT